MNPCLPDWNFESDLPFSNQKKPSGPNNDLVELLWQNGQVVMQSQTHRRPGLNHFDSQQLPHKQNGHNHHSQPQRAGGGGNSDGSYGNSSVVIQEDETVSWIHYPVEDSFEKEFCSHFFNELPAPDAVETDKPILAVPDQSCGRPSCGPDSSRVPNPMPPPSQPAQVQFPNSAIHQNHCPTKAMDLSQLSRPVKGDVRHSNPHFGTAGDVQECSGMTVGSSHCGSNQVVLNNPDFSRASSYGTGTVGLCSKVFAEDNIPERVPHDEGRKTETTLTSSSGGSGSSLGGTQKNSAGTTSSLKRKGRDAEDSDNQSEAVELESGGGKNPSQRSGSTRRSRAAEVHNLSERRRRDRINKKMKALQELIPHCNKTDKASMLDEAIEYLKSLQMQLQMMWIGSGMAAPMMFPGMQPYMSPMGIGMGPHPLATLHNNMNLPRVPMVDPQSMAVAPQNRNVMCQAPVLNPVNFPNQMQNQSLTEQFACYMGMQQLQAAASQPMSMFRFSPQTMPTSQLNNTAPGASNDDASSGKIS